MAKRALNADSCRVYALESSAIFFRTREHLGGLSNMAGGFSVEINQVRVPTVEALYQACRFPSDPEVQAEVVRQQSPMVAKMKSKAHMARTREDWLAIRHNVMRWCLRVKLAQHFDTFGSLLMSTGDMPIVERSRKDSYWGAVLRADSSTLEGQNVLGRLLMELREKVKVDPPESLLRVQPLRIPNFYFLGSPIAEIHGVRDNLRSDQDRGAQSSLL